MKKGDSAAERIAYFYTKIQAVLESSYNFKGRVERRHEKENEKHVKRSGLSIYGSCSHFWVYAYSDSES